MPITIAFIIELTVSLCALWAMAFLSTLLHELGHAVGYMLSTGDRHWHIRVGSGKELVGTKLLTVKLMVFDGCFEPAVNVIESRSQLLSTLIGGPVASVILTAAMLMLRLSGAPFSSDFFASGAIEFFINYALFLNAFILILSIIPIHYFHGEINGMETDGLKIINAVKNKNQR